jgi:hypothetical protein
VKCADGESINQALGYQADRLIISVEGTCTEFLKITRDDVTIQGVGTDPTITKPTGGNNAIAIIGAQRVLLQDLSITGGGIWVESGASLTGSRISIQDGPHSGLWMGNSIGQLQDSTISNFTFGVNMGPGSHLSLSNTFVSDNWFGVVVENAAVLNLGGSTVARNRGGVFLAASQAYIGDTSILDNGQLGSIHMQASQLVLDHSNVTGNENILTVGIGSALYVYGQTNIINNNGGIEVRGGSTLSVADGAIGGGPNPGISVHDTSVVSVGERAMVTGTSVRRSNDLPRTNWRDDELPGSGPIGRKAERD